MKELEKLLAHVRRAADAYGMIVPGDRIAVGLSGGKDSMTLLCALAALRRFSPIPFDLVGITVDLGFADSDGLFAPVESFCASLDVPYRRVPTRIADIVFHERREKNPCSLCSTMRRGALNNEARATGATKIALGHHMDDAAETFLMSLFRGGRIGCFSPVTVYENGGLTVIRPLIYAREREVRAVVRAEGIPVVKNPCPADGGGERAEMKELLRTLDARHRGIYARLIGALERGEVDGWGRNPSS